MNKEPRRGALAYCSLNSLGVILYDLPQEVVYNDGTKGIAYIGVHLTDNIAPKYSKWSSRNPRVICYLDDVDLFLEEHGIKK